MEMLKHALNWFEIPVKNFNRAKKFYSAIYDFEMPEEQFGPNRMGFLLFDRENGGIGGAIVKGENYVPSANGARIYLSGGTDLSVVLNRVEANGGKIIFPKVLIGPGLGYMAFINDTEGNMLGLFSQQ
jgi:predicted enzyme related to lactoylglutathione lyase